MPQDKLANYVETENIAHFTSLLETETDFGKRETFTKLLAVEKAKYTARSASIGKA